MSVKVFVSYSHKDERYLAPDSLLGFLKGLERTDDVQFWTDQSLSAGELWDETIKSNLADSDIALVLVSQWFLDSAYCVDTEIAGSLQLCRDRGLVILPVILSPCEWDRHEWLRSRQFLPRGGKTIEEDFLDPGRQKRLFFDVRQDLRKHVARARDTRRSAERRTPSATEAPAIRTYREEVDRVLRACHGTVRPEERRVLAALARRLAIGEPEVGVVESAALEEYRTLTGEYESALRDEIRREFPLAAPATARLERLREFLGLGRDDVRPIEQRLEQLPTKLARYASALEQATLETFPLTGPQAADLDRLQNILGLANEDVLPIRTRVASLSPLGFFGDVLPKTLEVQRELCALIGGRYGIRLTGDDPGEWTIDYTHTIVTPAIVDDVDLYLEMPSGEFGQLLDGTLDIVESVEAGRTKVLGRVDLFANLIFVLDVQGAFDATPVFLNSETAG
jgi:hypothetical protein